MGHSLWAYLNLQLQIFISAEKHWIGVAPVNDLQFTASHYLKLLISSIPTFGNSKFCEFGVCFPKSKNVIQP